MKRKTLASFLTLAFLTLMATPAIATTSYDANGITGTVYLYYDETGSDKWGDYAFTDKNGGKYIPSVQWSENHATVLPLNAKIYHPKDDNGKWILDDNDADILAVVALRGIAYEQKLAKLAQDTRTITQQYSPKEETFSWEVPMSERPPGTEDWIWTKSRWAKENWDNEKYGRSNNQNYQNNYSNPASGGFVQSIGNFDYYFLNNGQSGFGQRIGNFYYYNGL